MSNIILAIDTSINYCSVAIYKKKNIYTLSDKCNKEHTIKILPMIHKILLISNIKLTEINYIAFSKGPGNFTGIRISTGIAQSLSLSLKIPILGISTLSVIAEKAWRKYNQKKILIAIHAKTDKVYWAKYTRDKKLLWIGEKTESLLNFDEIKKKIKYFNNDWLLVGDGWEKMKCKDFVKFKKIKVISPNAKDIIPFSLFNIKNKNFLHATEVVPNYLNNIF
ncbi:tRNA (adenosine(37)-N6)-threonylcarbamoyltransferase complex dimerization subunit type 1 TsaB [Buchnera aphidicola (Aphis fabae)]|uniref:tRNA threonylcarbamoyladenosine biosynthesis protein TsaB n=1 Tax=Buchnera aphidicola (Aphis fabae) TaxID=571430 RepID=A0A5J6ZCR1_9GAMM|nr:tRNA (adenosine(37)-N6)-threonylcarbamoyltransferase complex dimerization subunit type 1 TsaB [Buchnera aphidicola]QFQ32498.1 tRNA (adenosine(37)-N6)-threonylcarbamoyltransferase complex dimerization subunit type 1 TsaB [Buchnera aphidicola (Aphis fabae)]